MNKVISPLLLLLLIPLFTTIIHLESRQSITDCTYLLAVLEKTLSYTLSEAPSGKYYAEVLLNTPVTPDLSRLHEATYKTIIEYYELLSGNTSKEEKQVKLSSVDEGLNSISQYAGKLVSCSIDREPAVALKTRIDLMINELRERIRELEVLFTSEDYYITIHTPRNLYNAGEEIPITITLKNTSCKIMDLNIVAGFEILESKEPVCTGGFCTLVISTPPAYSIEKYISSNGILDVLLVARTNCNNTVLKTYRKISVKYSQPRIFIETPSRITRGDEVTITLYSEKTVVQGVLIIKNSYNEIVIENLTISPNKLIVKARGEPPVFTPGYNTIKLCLNASDTTLSYCFEKPVFFELRHPPVEVKTPQVALTLDGRIPVLIIGSGNYTVEVVAGDLIKNSVSRVLNGDLSLQLFTSILPISIVDVNVSIRDLNGYYDPYKYTERIIVLNIGSLMGFTLFGVLSSIVLKNHEKSFLLLLKTGLGGRIEKPGKTSHGILEELLKPYITGLGSAIALIYYKLLRRFTQRLPHAYETLREHYYLVLKDSIKNTRVKELVWKLLLLAERDMYSREKPSVEEAKNIYERVFSEVEEE